VLSLFARNRLSFCEWLTAGTGRLNARCIRNWSVLRLCSRKGAWTSGVGQSGACPLRYCCNIASLTMSALSISIDARFSTHSMRRPFRSSGTSADPTKARSQSGFRSGTQMKKELAPIRRETAKKGKQIVNQRRFAAANVNDRRREIRCRSLYKLKRDFEARLVPTGGFGRLRTIDPFPMILYIHTICPHRRSTSTIRRCWST